MLVQLSIRDVVLIERLELEFADGLSVLTGETGAGKSILLDALGLALGARAEARLVRPGAKQASAAAEFEVPADHPVRQLLADNDVDAEPGEPVLLRRTVNAQGRSRAFVNDQPVGVGLLRQVGRQLVEVHGQFDTHGLLDPRTHLDVLDAYGGLGGERQKVAAAYRAWRDAEAARRAAQAEADRAREEEDYLRHAVAELDALAPAADEEDRLEAQRKRLLNKEKIAEGLNRAYAALAGDGGADSAVATAQRELGRIAELLGDKAQPVLDSLETAAAELEEAVYGLQGLSDDEEAGEESLDRIEERLFDLRSAARKHGTTVADLAALRGRLAERLDLIENQGERLAELARAAEEAQASYREAAQALTAQRREAAQALDTVVARELAPLKLDKARFATRVEPQDAPSAWRESGRDRVAFEVATNPGATPGPINKIASGGELARFMLALKVVLASVGTVPTLIFDEVDSGIGGATADAVGERLARLGAQRQVLVVTHAPQVAARGAQHWRVWKDSPEPESVVTGVDELDSAQRREEIARMLAGAEITQEARAAAEKLLGAA